MTDNGKVSGATTPGRKKERQEREAEALRANLRRRKEQARARDQAGQESGDPKAGDGET